MISKYINYNLDKNDSNDNHCKEEHQQQECNICTHKKLHTIENKIDCLQQIARNLEQLLMKLYKESLSSNNNTKISRINYNNRGWRS